MPRRDPRGFTRRLLNKAVRQFAFTDWYRLESAAMEVETSRHLCHHPDSIVHLMWADSDLGYLDLLRPRFPFRLCGTFHHCDDTLDEVLRHRGRLRRLDAAILMSKVQAPFFLANGVSLNRIHVVLHGVDTEFFRPLPQDGAGEFRVLSVGSYRRDFKQLRRLCEALIEQAGIASTIICPRSEIAGLEGVKGIRLLSGISDADLLEEYQSAQCFLVTAENSTANNAVLEALACGLPIVAERVGGIPEYVNAECAVLIERGEVDACVKAIRSVRDSRCRRESMGLAARARAAELDWRRVASQTLEVYKEVSKA